MTAPPNSGSSLTAQTSPGAGTVISLTAVCKRHSQAVTVSGFTGTGSARIGLEISLDDATWFQVPLGGSLIVTGNGTWLMRTTQDYPACYVRGVLYEVDAGVTAISVSSVCASE